MAKILVSGLINIETTLKISNFPLEYNPVNYPFFGVNTTVSGVGFNLAKALTTLGNEVNFLSIIGGDYASRLVLETLENEKINTEYVRQGMQATAQSVILFDENGRRQIHTDLKDIQEQNLPEDVFLAAVQGCDALALCNINFSRPFLQKALESKKMVATDVHTINNLDDEYNSDFMEAAHILFMSDEALPVSPHDWAGMLQRKYATEIIVIGLGDKGALLRLRGENESRFYPAKNIRKIVNTIGAGDALFSAFLHSYLKSGDPCLSLEKAMLFAAYKIGTQSAAEGFLSDESLEELFKA